MLILAADPGSVSSLSFIQGEESKIQLLDVRSIPIWDKFKNLPSSFLLREYLLSQKRSPELVVMEKVRSRPEQGISSTAKFMLCTGLLKGVLETLYKVEVLEIDPAVWKLTMGVTKDKKTSLALARKLFGTEHFLLAKDHDKAEASLIGAFVMGWRP